MKRPLNYRNAKFRAVFFFPGGNGGEMGRNFRAEPAVSDVPMPPGYLTVSVLTFVSVLFLALPVGIIGHECLGVF